MRIDDLYEEGYLDHLIEGRADSWKRNAMGAAMVGSMGLSMHAMQQATQMGDHPSAKPVAGSFRFGRGDWAGDPSERPLIEPHANKAEATPEKKDRFMRAVSAAAKSTGIRNQALLYLALTMWGEARDGGKPAMSAIGHVIVNRAKEDPERFGATIKDVALAHKQFSCWNANDPNMAKMMTIDKLPEGDADYEMWHDAVQIASRILSHRSNDPTKGATYYHTAAVHPFWAPTMHFLTKLGSHIFYRQPHDGEDTSDVQFAKMAKQRAHHGGAKDHRHGHHGRA